MAILLVLFRHMPRFANRQTWIGEQINQLSFFGWIGVDLFFVVSGFLVGGLLLQEYKQAGEVRIGRFLLRRAFKIYPAFYALSAVTLAVLIWKKQPLSLSTVLPELFFFQNYTPGLWRHTWSLAVEEHFYLLLALTTWWATRTKGQGIRAFQWVPLLCAALAGFCLLFRCLTVFFASGPHDTFLFPSHLRFDSLFAGVLLAYWFHFKPERFNHFTTKYRWWLMGFAIPCLEPAWFCNLDGGWFAGTFGLTLAYVGAAIILALMVNLPPPQSVLAFPARGLAYLGKHSYSVYLWHMLVNKMWFGKNPWSPLPKMTPEAEIALYMVASILIGILMTHLIEDPFLRLRTRLVPSRRSALGPIG